MPLPPRPRRLSSPRRSTTAALVLVASTAAACGGSSSPSDQADAGPVRYASGGTLTYAIPQDPGALDPLLSVLNTTRAVASFAYDTLLHTDEQGELVSGLAETWEGSASSAEFVLREGITCSDGAPLTATDVAANISFVADPANASPQAGIAVPPGAKAVADDAARTVTVTTAAPTPFLLESVGTNLQIVCAKGTADRKTLASETNGTGPYVLTESVADDHYTFTKRDGYAWGPDGTDSEAEGTPDEVVVQIVSNPATALNLLLSKEVNIARVGDAEEQRAKDAGLEGQGQRAAAGELWFNQAEGRPGSDEAVRQALVGGLDVEQVGSVLTGGTGVPSTGLVTLEPRICSGDTVTGTLPDLDTAEAEALLDEAGWTKGEDGVRSKDGKPLALRFLSPSTLGPNGTPGTELLAARWKELGVTVTITSPDDTALETALFSTGEWDAGFIPLQVSLPTQYASFVSGPTPPTGANFANISNPEYEKAAAAATSLTGDEACARYEEGEKALIAAADIAPLVDKQVSIYGNGAQFRVDSNGLVVQSLRLLA